MDGNLPILLGGLHSLGFAAFHLAFWKLFAWKHELALLSRVNRGIVQILNLRLTYVFLGIGVLCLGFPQELRSTSLGRGLLLFMALFWVGRTVEQFVFLRLRHPAVHALTVLFVVGAVLFAIPLFATAQ